MCVYVRANNGISVVSDCEQFSRNFNSVFTERLAITLARTWRCLHFLNAFFLFNFISGESPGLNDLLVRILVELQKAKEDLRLENHLLKKDLIMEIDNRILGGDLRRFEYVHRLQVHGDTPSYLRLMREREKQQVTEECLGTVEPTTSL